MNFSINPFTDDLAVDLGTVHTFIYGRGRGMIVNEPSLVAIDKISNEVIAVGNEALEMLGRSPEDVEVAYPMQDGVVADSQLAQTMLKKFVRKARGGGPAFHVALSRACRRGSVPLNGTPSGMWSRGLARAAFIWSKRDWRRRSERSCLLRR